MPHTQDHPSVRKKYVHEYQYERKKYGVGYNISTYTYRWQKKMATTPVFVEARCPAEPPKARKGWRSTTIIDPVNTRFGGSSSRACAYHTKYLV